jgi:glycosyltransferase involved in cell wall biosynthesis
MRPLVSIIMPAFNAERFIGEAIISVLAQTYDNWELLIVNDGSTDATSAVIASFTDPRIRVFHQINKGIGSARNLGLDHVRGSLLCGLDSDDKLPSDSLECRVSVFEAEPHTDIVDGRVLFMDGELKNTVRVFLPHFEGDPFPDLIAFTGKSFMGFSWMIRWGPDHRERFSVDLTHGEDLLFYMQYANGKRYKAVDRTVLIYRRTGHSTMTNLRGLERSYIKIGKWLADSHRVSRSELHNYQRKRKRIMAGSYWKAGQPLLALRALFI